MNSRQLCTAAGIVVASVFVRAGTKVDAGDGRCVRFCMGGYENGRWDVLYVRFRMDGCEGGRLGGRCVRFCVGSYESGRWGVLCVRFCMGAYETGLMGECDRRGSQPARKAR
ncbi:hypothetical protein G1C96_1006 [Bifidobacterium sp. DSM 109958]|uniref:Uncharacterized protein n=1 Tax=Bifidobacterium moraviense TaxID=2675323 RepID=A0A7Y0HYI2_9BIFI|nr:hypothetical protein [Bifidobacterium sp. DSM 109958]